MTFVEHRILLTHKEAFELSKRLKVLNSSYVKDEYTGSKRHRIDPNGITEKDYSTPVSGTIVRISSRCELDGIKNVWFEVKWTENTIRFEIEFEGEVPEEYESRPNIKGWDILNN